MVMPTSPTIAGSNVTTTYASSAATKSAAPPGPAGGVGGSRGRRGDAHRAVEVADRDFDRRFLATVSECSVERRFANQVVRRSHPHMRCDGAVRAQFAEQAPHLVGGVRRGDLISVLAGDLVRGYIFRTRTLRDHGWQASGWVEQLGH